MRCIFYGALIFVRNDARADVYDYVFIDSGSPDSYLAGELGIFVNDTLLLNGTINGTDLVGNGTTTGLDEPLGDVIAMAVTSLILGLMILVTVIGECRRVLIFRLPTLH